MRILDFRRGDDDDNRTSPYGRGMRSVVFSAVLEFNYLQAPIGFLALIIGPALLVGIAPSVVVTYSRMMIDASAMAGSRPIVAVALLAVLAGAALWIGWPLLRMAVDNFWHLHYTLVFPIFVAVRELLRVFFERRHGRSITPEQHDRGRRLGTVLAALLLAGGGLALAMSIEVSIGLQLVDVEHVRLWAVARAALGNAAVVFGLSTAAESLYWIWRELSLKGPGSAIGCQRRRKPTNQSSGSRICRTCTSSASATAIAWRPARTAHAATGAFAAPCASSRQYMR